MSQSVVQGDREPVQSRDYAPKNGDDVSVPEGSSTDQLAQADDPRIADAEISADLPTSHGGSHAERVRGSPSQSTRRSYTKRQRKPAGLADVLHQTLNSDEMTARACRLMITLGVSLAIVLVPVAAVAFIVMVKAPVEWKYILGGGSAVFVSVGSWFFSRRRAARRTRRSPVSDSSEEPTQDN
jgi:hypothetical protein